MMPANSTGQQDARQVENEAGRITDPIREVLDAGRGRRRGNLQMQPLRGDCPRRGDSTISMNDVNCYN